MYTGGNVFIFELNSVAKKYFDTFDFTSLDSRDRPTWIKGIKDSNKMKQNIENMQNDLLNSL